MKMNGATQQSSTASRCVLWHAPGTLPPRELLESLERRGVSITSCSSAFRAMARVCELEQENDRRTNDPTEREALVLVLVSPRTLADPGSFVDAMKVYAPRTACWWYDASANPRLRAVVDEDVEEWLATGVRAGQPVVIRPPDSMGAPRLRLAGDVGTDQSPESVLSRCQDQVEHGTLPGMGQTRREPRRQSGAGA